jgi:NOL1/NOP2/fmu family ribosome biogenesis protein
LSHVWLKTEEQHRLLKNFCERFGIPAEVFEGLRLLRSGAYVHAVADEAAEAVERLHWVDAGVRLLKIMKGDSVKPATRGVQLFGHHATRNLVDVTDSQLRDLMAGRLVGAEGEKGYVILRLRGECIGVALRRDGRLLSQLPQAMVQYLKLTGDAPFL